jgi:hypothetical protein
LDFFLKDESKYQQAKTTSRISSLSAKYTEAQAVLRELNLRGSKITSEDQIYTNKWENSISGLFHSEAYLPCNVIVSTVI